MKFENIFLIIMFSPLFWLTSMDCKVELLKHRLNILSLAAKRNSAAAVVVDAQLNNQQEQQTTDDSYKSCGFNRVCVPFYLCHNQTGTLNVYGENLIDVRYDAHRPCSPYLEQCCAVEDIEHIAEHLQNESIPPVAAAHEAAQPSCGQRNTDGIIFKITGHRDGETEYGEFPWMIAVLKLERTISTILNIYQCGGSLIHPSVVMTAAHCVFGLNADDLVVRAGEWDTQTKDEFFREQDNAIKEIVIHEQFARGGLHNNIALLITTKPFELAMDVSTLCLPPKGMNFDYSSCYATGWGKDSFGQDGKYQVILKKIELPIVPRQICQSMLRTTRLGRFFKLHESFLCAGGELGKDTCRGDGGGPLSCPIKGQKDRFYQSGIVSWGIGCGDATPGVYVDVAKFRDWIDGVFERRGLDSSYYTYTEDTLTK